MACAYFVLAAWLAYLAVSSDMMFLRLSVATIACLLAAGLLRRSASARTFTVWVLWFIVIVVPFGMINPFAAINGRGPPFPDVWDLVIWIYPCVAAALVVLHILGKHKKEFT
jgi:hypothetical protein